MKPFFLLLMAFPLSALGQNSVSGSARVIDGDTLKIGRERVRMAGIDAPELKQRCDHRNAMMWPCGVDSRQALREKIGDAEVQCEYKARDRYRRILGTCYAEGVNLSSWMVRQGWALAYRRYSTEYVEQEEQAKADGIGLWVGKFIKPWKWRRKQR